MDGVLIFILLNFLTGPERDKITINIALYYMEQFILANQKHNTNSNETLTIHR